MLLTTVAVSLLLQPLFTHAFSFSYTSPTQCDPLTIQWQGGTPPFTLLITPTFSTPTNLTIPDSAWTASSSSGSYTLPQLPVASQKQFLLTMSDATGIGSGGTSALLTAGSQTGSQKCNTQPVDPPFTFATPSALQQCRPYSISSYDKAVQPITIVGLIPLGQTFILHPPNGPVDYSWQANVKSGTQIIVLLIDAQGRSGGSSDIMPIGASDDSSCLNAQSPSSTAGGPTASTSAGTGTATHPTTTKGHQSPSTTSVPNPGNSSSHGAVIGGAIAGVVVALVALVSLGWFLYRRRKQQQDRKKFNSQEPHMHSVERLPGSTADLGEAAGDYVPVPYVLPPQDQYSDYGHSTNGGHGASTYGSYAGQPTAPTDPRSHTPSSMFSSPHTTASSKAALAAREQQAQAPTRFVLHTDAGSAFGDDAPDEEDEVVELPPQYASLTPAQRKASMRRDNQLAASGSRPPPSDGAGPSAP